MSNQRPGIAAIALPRFFRRTFPFMQDPLTIAVTFVELAMAFAGAVLLWRHVFSPVARATVRPSPLAPWQASPADFFTCGLYVFVGYFLAGLAAAMAGRAIGLTDDAAVILNGAGAQIGVLLGLVMYRGTYERDLPPPGWLTPTALKAGAATFLMALPLVLLVGKGWEVLLDRIGVPAENQELVEMFARLQSPWQLVTMVILAVIVAPLVEELVFRARLFRYLLHRLPRPVAYVLPALMFAALHVTWTTLDGIASFVPLVVLAIVFSAAYERTGEIGTAIVAHALFNLNTIAMIFAGIPTA